PFARTRHVRQFDPGASLLPAHTSPAPAPVPVSRAADSPAPSSNGAASPAAPSNPVEEELVQIWRELLRVPAVGVDDNFFELGGQSLVGVQLLSRIRQTWAVELPLRALFAGPTIAELALAIEEALVAEIEGEASEDHQPPD